MGSFTKIPKDTFDALQMDAGVLLKTFDLANPDKTTEDDIITATTGGINAVCQPTYSDLGEDVDNCPVNMKELKHLDSWTCTLGFTALGTSAESIRLELGAADINAENGAIIPRRDLKQTDFADVWWVGDKANGGFVAVRLINALSTDGFSLQTTKSGKGQISTTLTGHVSIEAQDVVPMEFYSIDPSTTEQTTDDGKKEEAGTDTKNTGSDTGKSTDDTAGGNNSQTGSDSQSGGTSGAKKNTLSK